MDKLNIVEKAKRYDEAIKKLRSLHDNYDTVSTLIDVKEELENIFPELAENEDERIRKWCISHFKECINVIKDNDEYKEYLNNKVIPWLEKHSQVKEFPIFQHENKTCKENDDSLTSEDERIKEELISNFKEAIENIKSEEIIPHSAKVLVCKMQKWIAWLEKKCEQKPTEWSEEERQNVESIIAALTYCNENGVSDCFVDPDILIDWLESFKDRVQPQPKQEWNEDDERLFQIVIDILDKEEHKGHLSHTDLIACVKKLKFLRPQNRWKPNKEQMNGLKEAIEFLGCTKTRREPLQSLYEQLKKLK